MQDAHAAPPRRQNPGKENAVTALDMYRERFVVCLRSSVEKISRSTSCIARDVLLLLSLSRCWQRVLTYPGTDGRIESVEGAAG